MRCFLLLCIFFTTILFSNEPKSVTLQLQWKYQFQFAGYLIAKEKGFYNELGLNVDIKEWKEGQNPVDEVISENATYSVSRSTSLIDINEGKKIKYLAAIFQSTPLILLTDKSSGITKIKDFKNKNLISPSDTNLDSSIVSMLYSQGLKLEDINIQKQSFDVSDLLNNKSDLMASYISNEPFALKKLGGNPVIFNPKDYGFDFYSDILITSEKYFQKQKDEVAKFRNASLKGWEYAFENIEESVDILFLKYNTQNKSKEALLYEAKELKKLAYFGTKKLGKIESKKLEKIYELYKLLGYVDKEIDFDKLIFKENDHTLELSENEKNYLQKKKKLTMCIDPNWMPYEKLDKDGKLIGMTAEYFQLFEKMLPTKFEVIQTSSWPQSLQYGKERKCDMLSLAMETPDRKKYFHFTTPYIETTMVISTKDNSIFINKPSDLKGKKIGISKGYAFAVLLREKYDFLNIIDVENINDGLNKVKRGELFGYIDSLTSIGYIIQHEYTGELKISGKFDETLKLGVGVRNDETILFSILQKAVNNLEEDQKRKIFNKWISVKYEKNIDPDLIWKILLFIFVVGAIFVYKQYLLNKSIREISEIIDSTMEAIFISRDKICIDLNQSAVEMFGFSSKKDVIGKNILDLVAEESKSLIIEKMKKDVSDPFEGVAQRKDKTTFPAFMKGHNVKDKDIRISSVVDITHLKLLESQSKLASMGEMIGNIAHQWRQPLSVISTISTGMKMQKEYNLLSDEEFNKGCDNIDENVQYLSHTIDDFRNYISGDSSVKRFNLKSDTESFIKLVDSTISKYNIQLILNLDQNINIVGYPNELIQCFMNIFNNARDALLEKKIEENERFIFITQELKDEKAIIKFKDNATGIPKDVISHIFEPYFTTKDHSTGTGIGLNMTHNLIVNSMQGKIEVETVNYEFNNKKYKGTEFIITIPISI